MIDSGLTIHIRVKRGFLSGGSRSKDLLESKAEPGTLRERGGGGGGHNHHIVKNQMKKRFCYGTEGNNFCVFHDTTPFPCVVGSLASFRKRK